MESLFITQLESFLVSKVCLWEEREESFQEDTLAFLTTSENGYPSRLWEIEKFKKHNEKLNHPATFFVNDIS